MNMKIACITAGAGNMYCGSCLRDNALASALLAAGHDVLLIPTYTPTRTDENNVSMPRVFMGGINIYLQQHFSLFRKSPEFLDRLWDYKPLLRLVTKFGMSVNPADLGNLTVSMLQGTKGFLQKEISKLVRFLQDFSPDVVNLPNSMLIALAPAIKAAMKVPVCCSLQGEELFLGSLREPYRRKALELIRQHTGYVDAFIALSHFGADSMAGFLGIDRDRIRVVPLGINLDGFDPVDASGIEPFTIGYLARIAPEKGLHVLCDAYRLLLAGGGLPPSRLWAAGYLAPEQKSYLSDICRRLDSCGLASQFHYHGELDRHNKLQFLKSLSVFSVPETYDDPKALFLLEALACGIPVVQPRRGALSEIVETTGGGLLVEPDNPKALAEGLRELWNDPQKRQLLGDQGSRAVREHYSAARMADAALAAYQSVL
jgi:glycosyltransferase involved in cell wall biosynthesis